MKLRLLALAVVAVFLPAPSSATAADTFTVWMSPNGDDSAAGTSRDNPVRTFAGAQRILCPTSPCVGLGSPVDIRIEPGTYNQPEIKWRYFDDQYPTRFMPADYQLGQGWTDVSATGGRPVFDGLGKALRGFSFVQWRSAERTNFEFYYLDWRRYIREALIVEGADGIGRAGRNVFVGNYIHRIGNAWDPGLPMAYAGVWLGRSDGNIIRGNHFTEILNEPAVGRGHEHGIYLVNSRTNLIAGNQYTTIGGDPIRFRDRSSANTVTGNVFKQAGGMGYVDDWYCRPSLVSAGACPLVEYRSWGNILKANTFLGLYPRSYTGRATAYCYDLLARCPTDRITVS